MARVKRVFSNTSEAMHAYTGDNECHNGKARSSNVSWFTLDNGDRILRSYATYICVRKRLKNDTFVFYVSSNTYSISTSKQLNYLRRAIPGDSTVFTVPVSLGRGTWPMCHLSAGREYLYDCAKREALRILRARLYTDLNSLWRLLAIWQSWITFHKVKGKLTKAERITFALLEKHTPINNLDDLEREQVIQAIFDSLGANKQKIAQAHKKQRANEESNRRKREEQERKARQARESILRESWDKDVPQWRAHTLMNHQIPHEFTLLRINPRTASVEWIDANNVPHYSGGKVEIQSNHSATISYDEACQLWPVLCHYFAEWEKHDGTAVDFPPLPMMGSGWRARGLVQRDFDEYGYRFNADQWRESLALVIGCHTIPFSEVVAIARELKLAIPDCVHKAYPILETVVPGV